MWFHKKKKIESVLSLTINNLDEKQKRFAFRLLLLLLAHQITPFEFQAQMLTKLGYKPKRKNELEKHFFIIVAENMSILFKVIGNEIILDYDFTENPFPNIAKYTPTFTRNFTIDTNITARQFADCLDYLREFNNTECDVNSPESLQQAHELRLHLLAKIAETLYKTDFETAKKLPFEVLFAVQMWFVGISAFFHKHPTYSILFQKTGENESENTKISLGMSETLLHLQKEGYGNAPEMNIVDFFNAQIKSLKDNIADAIAKGAKIADLAVSMKLDTGIISRLL
ncbi:MAG: hypothetical protein LBB53_06775 [Prevotellaceae bacterium]|jgi:hypothetical protein|nr:hypothetical protein [Prevotellaceae bacterium]